MPEISVQTQQIDRDELAKFVPAKNFRLFKFFENMAQDVGVTIPAAIEASVQGPVNAFDGDVAVFDGTSGARIKDSGVPITSLAPLDSPAFTGIPTAPTAPQDSGSTQIATTAYVDLATATSVVGPAVAVDDHIATFDGVTGKLIQDSGVLISDVVTGPASATAGRVATYNGATGKVIQDGGVLLSALAPLASPALTGNPTAPTAALNDNDTSIATTAFVQAQVESLNAAYFSAHNNGVSQSIPNATFTKLTFSTETYDVGSKFASSAWTPPARLVMMVGTVALPTADGADGIIAIYKNGVKFKQGSSVHPGSGGFIVIQVSCLDVANGTDVYELYCEQATGSSQNTSGGADVTYFQGMTVRP